MSTNEYVQVYSIRDAAATNLKRLAEEFGPDWAMQHIVPQVFFYFFILNDVGIHVVSFLLYMECRSYPELTGMPSHRC